MKHTTARQQEIGDVFTLDGGRATSGHTTQTPKVAPAKPSEQGAPLPGMTKQRGKQWYEANTGNHQGLIVDLANGRNVAVCYDKADAPLIAAAPDLFNALERIVRDLEYTWGGENQMPPAERAYYAPAKAALLKAQGGARQ